jgi:hypothetical protein
VGKRDVEFSEFFAVAWARLYRTTYAVAGNHSLTQRALNHVLVSAYADWSDLGASPDVESAVADRALDEVLASLATSPPPAGQGPAKIGPFVPYGEVIRATPESKARVEELWAELHSLPAEDRADIAIEAAERSRLTAQPQSVDVQLFDSADSRRGRLIDFVTETLSEVVVSDADLSLAIAAGKARQRRRRWLTLGAAGLVIALIAVPLSLWDPPAQTPDTGRAEGSWREVTPAPLSPRWAATALWTGKEVVVMGGESEATCDDRGQCTELTDAAAYDPQRDAWRKVADLPFDGFEIAQRLGSQLIVLGDGHWWQYDPDRDVWNRLPNPPERTPAARTFVTTSDSAIYTVGDEATDLIQVFDLKARRWSTLPPSPFQPQLERRQLVVTPLGLVALGASREAPLGDPFLFPEVYGEVYDGADWTRLPRSRQMASSCCWLWSGERIFHNERLPVYAAPGTAKGVRFSGGMYFDPTDESWGFIREMPNEIVVESAQLYAADGPQVAFDHLIYDDRERSWTRLPGPAQAPLHLTSATWVDGTLFAFGGANLDEGFDINTNATNRAWIYTPAPPQMPSGQTTTG